MLRLIHFVAAFQLRRVHLFAILLLSSFMEKHVLKKLLPIVSLALLFGCAADQNDRAQQYLDGEFPNILNKTDVVESNKPQDFTEFNKQAEQVVINSPSMAKMYQPLYEN